MKSLSLLRSLLIASAWLLIASGAAHAHGGMAGPDVIGPPVGLSVALALIFYFGITLWPRRGDQSRKRGSRRW